MALWSLIKIESEYMDAETSLDSSVMQKENTGLPPTKTDGVRPLIHRSILKEKSDLSEMIWKQTKKSLSVMDYNL